MHWIKMRCWKHNSYDTPQEIQTYSTKYTKNQNMIPFDSKVEHYAFLPKIETAETTDMMNPTMVM